MDYDDKEQTHLARIGKMIENLEGVLRSELENVYFGKTKEVSCGGCGLQLVICIAMKKQKKALYGVCYTCLHFKNKFSPKLILKKASLLTQSYNPVQIALGGRFEEGWKESEKTGAKVRDGIFGVKK